MTTFAAIFLLRPLAIRIGLVDKPSYRKPHTGSVPLIGGIAMYIGVVITIFSTFNDVSQITYLLSATILVVIFGSLDDYRHLPVSIRLLLQIIIAIIIIKHGDTSIETFGNLFGNGNINLNRWSDLVSIVAIIAAMNALNMSDGIHGLAGGGSLITLIAILYLSFGNSHQDLILIVLIFCSVLPIFLINNICIGVSVSRRIFMGDAGSMLLGLIIAWALIKFSQGDTRQFNPVTALWLFAVPVIEITASIGRRLTSGKSPFKPDLFHSHHLLMRIGFNEKSTLLIMIGFSFFMAIIGVIGEVFEISEWVMFIGFISIFVFHISCGRYLYYKYHSK